MLTSSAWYGVYIVLNVNVTIQNGVINNGSNTDSHAIMSYGNLTVDWCTLTSSNDMTVLVCDGSAEIKNSVISGGVEINNSYTDSATLYATENVLFGETDSKNIYVLKKVLQPSLLIRLIEYITPQKIP